MSQINTPAARTQALGVKLNPDGSIAFRGLTLPATEGVFGFEITGGARMYRAPGQQTVVIAHPPSRTFVAASFRQGTWVDASSRLMGRWAGRRETLKLRRRPFLVRLRGPARASTQWVPLKDTVNPLEQQAELKDDGALIVGKTRFVRGQAYQPTNLPCGWLLTRPGRDEVYCHADQGVVERFRYDDTQKRWSRGTERVPLAMNVKDKLVTWAADGRIVFEDEWAPRLIIPSGQAFTVHHSATQPFERRETEGSVIAVDCQKRDEFFYERYQWSKVIGARDRWISRLVGCPGGRLGVSSVDILQGLNVTFDGYVRIGGRTYFPGAAIDIQTTQMAVRRAAGLFEHLQVISYAPSSSTPSGVTAYRYAADGEWYELTPRSPDVPWRSWERAVLQDGVGLNLDELAQELLAETPVIRELAIVLGFISVQLKGFTRCNHLLPLVVIGAIAGSYLSFVWTVLYLMALLFGLPYRWLREFLRVIFGT
jgi:hypothetical protein